MFLVGAELDPEILRGRKHTAVVTSHVSIIVPFFLGTLLALYLYPRLSDNSVAFTHFALFVGTAMSITAFPVLARILTERNLLHGRIGAVSIACAAVDDVTAWCILAGVILLVRSSSATLPLWLMVIGTVPDSGYPIRIESHQAVLGLLAPAIAVRLNQRAVLRASLTIASASSDLIASREPSGHGER